MSNIIKSNFVSFNEQKNSIKNISNANSRIINNKVDVVEKESVHNETKEGSLPVDDNSLEKDAVKEDAEAIIEKAKIKADELIAMANDQAIIEGNKIKEEAKKSGYEEGYAQGKVDGENEYSKLIAQVTDERNNLAIEKSQLVTSVEKKIAGIVKGLVTNLVGVHQYNDDTIIHIIRKGFLEVELYDDLIIKVSKEDYDTVINNIDMLTADLSQKSNVEVLKDMNLNKNDCVLETELGNINCSLGLRLEGLTKELQLIGMSLNSNCEEE